MKTRPLFNILLGLLCVTVFASTGFAARILLMPSRYAMVIKGLTDQIANTGEWDNLHLWAIAYPDEGHTTINELAGCTFHWRVKGIDSMVYSHQITETEASRGILDMSAPMFDFAGVTTNSGTDDTACYTAEFYITKIGSSGSDEYTDIYNQHDSVEVPIYLRDFTPPTSPTWSQLYRDYPGTICLMDYLENIARGRGIRHLLLSQQSDGRWDSQLYTGAPVTSNGYNCPIGVTGIVMAALGSDPGTIYYAKTLENYVAASNNAQAYLRGRMEANGGMVYFNNPLTRKYANYEQGAALMGLSLQPAITGFGPNFTDFAKKMARWFDSTQNKAGLVPGGWRYCGSYTGFNFDALDDADLSASQWPVLGLLTARARIARDSGNSAVILDDFDNVASDLKTQLRRYARAVQSETGVHKGGAYYGAYNPSLQKWDTARTFGAEGKGPYGDVLPNPRVEIDPGSEIDYYHDYHPHNLASVLTVPAVGRVQREWTTPGSAARPGQWVTKSLGYSARLTGIYGTYSGGNCRITLNLPDPNSSGFEGWVNHGCSAYLYNGVYSIYLILNVNPTYAPGDPSQDWKIRYINGNVPYFNIVGASGYALPINSGNPDPSWQGIGTCQIYEKRPATMRDVECVFTPGNAYVYVNSQVEANYINSSNLYVSSYREWDPGQTAVPAIHHYEWNNDVTMFGMPSEMAYNERWLLGTSSLFTMMRYLNISATDDYYKGALDAMYSQMVTFQAQGFQTTSTVDRGARGLDLYTMFCVTKALKANSSFYGSFAKPALMNNPAQTMNTWREKFVQAILENIESTGYRKDSWEMPGSSVLGTALAVLILKEEPPYVPLLMTRNETPAGPRRLQAFIKQDK